MLPEGSPPVFLPAADRRPPRLRFVTDSNAPPPGFYEGADGRRRWWNGAGWSDSRTRGVVHGGGLREEERRAILDRAVAKYVENGYMVQANTGRQAVVVKRQRLNVPLNLLLALFTGGVWLIFLAVRLTNWPTDRVVLTVNDQGDLTGDFSS